MARKPLRSDVQGICLEAPDHSIVRRSATRFFQLNHSRDPQAQAARLAEQFVRQNRAALSSLEVTIEPVYDGNDVHLTITTGSSVGSVALLSPTSGKPDYSLSVRPRFPWSGIGPMLAEMGWRVVPQPLALPKVKGSERQIPLWVMASMLIARLQALIESLDRRFELIHETNRVPKGSVQWTRYATREIPAARLLDVPCTFPDLRSDRELKGAIRFALECQLRALETQQEHGGFIHRLIARGEQLLSQVRDVPSYSPSPTAITLWRGRPMRTSSWVEGLEAIEWTVQGSGLGGSSELAGIPWAMSMDQFFEAWVETVIRRVSVHVGGHLKVARRRETTVPIIWDPPYIGSQKSLAPDVWLESEACTLIVDAKYKRHWEDLQETWSAVDISLRDEHRRDLLQVLAYANMACTPRVIACLVYPCSQSQWESLRDRGTLFHKAILPANDRILELWLTAMPMNAAADRTAIPIAEELRRQARGLADSSQMLSMQAY